jgi:ArsR family transcriptional regulator
MVSADLFKALGDTTRQRLLQVLCTQEMSVSELVDVLEQPQSTISRHLKVLREAGLLLDRRTGSTVMYSARPPGLPPIHNGEETPEKNGNGSKTGPSIRDRLLDWLGREPMDKELRQRMESVVRRRTGTDFFEGVGSRWDFLRAEAFGNTYHLEALTALLPRDWTAADIGMGTGYMLPMLSRRFAQVIAIDPAGAMIETARNRPELRSTENVEFREGSLSSLPIQNGEVNLAIASLVLHHVVEPAEAIVELRRCLADQGRLLIIEQQTHDFPEFQEYMGDYWRGFDPATLEKWAHDAGLEDVQVTPLFTARPAHRNNMTAPPLFALTATAVAKGENKKA